MKVLLVLPPDEILEDQIDRAIRGISYIVKNVNSVTIAAPQAFIPYHEQLFPDKKILSYERDIDLSGYEIIIHIEGQFRKIVDFPIVNSNKRIYKATSMGRLILCNPDIDELEYPHLSTHIFNRLSVKLKGRNICGNGHFYYFPYGYLSRYTGLGPINEFGHRIALDLETLVNRGKNHKVIAIFGGSAAYSLATLFDEMFHYKLEKKLNAYCLSNSSPYSFSVLNFAQHGNVILNEILTYVLFCNTIKPDIVIAHDGFNDFSYGQAADPHLLAKYDINYQFNFEGWSQILHNSEEMELDWAIGKISIKNYPRTIINAYSTRQLQFQKMVQINGGIFIAGLQPSIYSKKALSQREKRYLDFFYKREDMDKLQYVMEKIPFLYEKYLQKQSSIGLQYFANLHSYFYQFDERHTLFADTMHTTHEGDEAISDFYFNYLSENILSKVIDVNLK